MVVEKIINNKAITDEHILKEDGSDKTKEFRQI